jgi:hypothetical protein
MLFSQQSVFGFSSGFTGALGSGIFLALPQVKQSLILHLLLANLVVSLAPISRPSAAIPAHEIWKTSPGEHGSPMHKWSPRSGFHFVPKIAPPDVHKPSSTVLVFHGPSRVVKSDNSFYQDEMILSTQ